MPIFGYKQVDFLLENSPVVLLSKEYNSFDEFFKAFSGVI